MDTTFMNSKNSKTSKQNVLVSKLTDKLDLRNRLLHDQILAFITHAKI